MPAKPPTADTGKSDVGVRRARRKLIVIGHLTPTDADPDPAVQGLLDEGVGIVACDTQEEVERTLLWYQDGIVRELDA